MIIKNSETELEFLTIKPIHQNSSKAYLVSRKCSVKKCSQKFRKTDRKKPVLEFFCLNKRATLLKKRLGHRCFPVNFAKLRTPFLLNTSGSCFFQF